MRVALLALILVAVAAAVDRAPGFVDATELKELRARYGDAAYRRGEMLNQLVAELQTADTWTKVKEVNRFFNQFPYQSDKSLWGQEDYWQTPLEFLGRNGGDCEDYVISKYFVLRALGLRNENLYLTYVKAVEQNVAHMVLSYFETPQSVPYILDNYNPMIMPATERRDLVPVYSFNAESLFLANSAGLGQALPVEKVRNSKWEKLLRDAGRSIR